MKKNILLLVMLLLWTGNNYGQVEDDTTGMSNIRATGVSLDEHGCNTACGSTWSQLIKKCILLSGLDNKFDTYGTNKSYKAKALVSKDRQKVELFSPLFQNESIILDLVKTKKREASFYENKQEKVKIYLSKGKYYISVNDEPVFIQEKKMKNVFAM